MSVSVVYEIKKWWTLVWYGSLRFWNVSYLVCPIHREIMAISILSVIFELACFKVLSFSRSRWITWILRGCEKTTVVFLYLIISVNSIAIIFFYSSTPRFISSGFVFYWIWIVPIRKIRSFCISIVSRYRYIVFKIRINS